MSRGASVVFRGVSFAYGDAVPLLEDVSFRLETGIHGVVGENGGGKTTLLRLVSGELSPDRGEVKIAPPGAVVALCPQTVDELGDDVRALADDGGGAAFELRDVLGLSPEGLCRWGSLSPGERRRWQLAAALHREPDVLLCDEPTNHLDAGARARIAAALRRFRGVALVVSHDRGLLDEVTSGTARVGAGAIDVYTLPYSRARAEWERQADARATERELKKEAHAAAERRLADARDQRARADRMRSSKSRMKDKNDHDARGMGAKVVAGWAESRLGRLVGTRRGEVERAAAAIPEGERTRGVGRSVFVGYEPAPRAHVLRLDTPALRAGDVTLLREVHVAVERSARVHVAGPNGAGKTTLVRALVEASALPPDKLLFVPQEMSSVEAGRLLDEVRSLAPAEKGRALSLVAAMGADPDRLLASRAPSPGEARKLAVALGLGRRVWALVLDEPSNHLDLPSIERLEAALAEFPGALVMVSHDDALAARLTTERWSLEDGELRRESANRGGPPPDPGSHRRARRVTTFTSEHNATTSRRS